MRACPMKSPDLASCWRAFSVRHIIGTFRVFKATVKNWKKCQDFWLIKPLKSKRNVKHFGCLKPLKNERNIKHFWLIKPLKSKRNIFLVLTDYIGIVLANIAWKYSMPKKQSSVTFLLSHWSWFCWPLYNAYLGQV